MWLTISYYIINPTILANQPKKWDSQYDHPTIYIYLEYIKIDRDKSTFKSHRDFDSEIEMTFKHF